MIALLHNYVKDRKSERITNALQWWAEFGFVWPNSSQPWHADDKINSILFSFQERMRLPRVKVTPKKGKKAKKGQTAAAFKGD